MTHPKIATSIREVLDPNGTLPVVELKLDPDEPLNVGTLVPEAYFITSEGQTLGSATLVHNKKTKEAWFNGVRIEDEDLRREGYGLATYLAGLEEAHSRGETFRTHMGSQTDAAVKVWQRFVKARVAEVVEPFVRSQYPPEDPRGGVSTGLIRIPPTSKD